MTREQAKEIYLDWINNYLTIATYADHHGLSEREATRLIDLVRDIYNTKHPEE